MRYPALNDSPAVLELKAKLDEMVRDGSDWGRSMRKRYAARIRAQRLAEARERGTHTPEQWNEILERYDYRCVQCGCEPVGRPCKDHIVPIYQGGSDAVENLQPLCRECNTGKGPDNFNWAAYRDEHGFSDARFDKENL